MSAHHPEYQLWGTQRRRMPVGSGWCTCPREAVEWIAVVLARKATQKQIREELQRARDAGLKRRQARRLARTQTSGRIDDFSSPELVTTTPKTTKEDTT